jgi:hypothetical protein
MSGENGSFIHPGIRQEAISSFGVGPVLAGERNTFSEPGRELLQELLQALTQPLVRKRAASDFLFDPLGVSMFREESGWSSPSIRSACWGILVAYSMSLRTHLGVPRAGLPLCVATEVVGN